MAISQIGHLFFHASSTRHRGSRRGPKHQMRGMSPCEVRQRASSVTFSRMSRQLRPSAGRSFSNSSSMLAKFPANELILDQQSAERQRRVYLMDEYLYEDFINYRSLGIGLEDLILGPHLVLYFPNGTIVGHLFEISDLCNSLFLEIPNFSERLAISGADLISGAWKVKHPDLV